MADIIPFAVPGDGKNARIREQQSCWPKDAEILIFPGIRYDRPTPVREGEAL